MSCCAQRVLAGRRVGCDKSGSAFDTPDTYAYLYNTRSELTNATAAVDSAYRYGYNFDDIGNRRSSLERRVQSAEYEANNLNQYTAVDDFTPAYDADGNETVVKTATGVWQVTYNGENRPMRWENGDTIITMSFDRMGRRVTKNDWRFVYNGYLQVGNFHCSTSTCRGEAERSRNLQPSTFIWDCTENVATRPLVWNKDGDASYYVFDGNKNVSEVIDSGNDVAAHYEYAPFGALTVSRGVSAAANPWRFSSEYAEDDTATVYYNYRHYEPVTGRWFIRDFAEDLGSLNLYAILNGNPISRIDLLGLKDGMSTRGGGYECSKLSGQTFSAHKGFMAFGAQLHFDMDLSIEGKKCKKCCNSGTARAGQEVFDEDYSIVATGKISGGKSTIWKKFDSSDFGGWWAAPNVKGELYAGIKVEGFGLVSASGNVGSDRCDNHELSGSVCTQVQFGLAVSGGAVFDMYWNSAHFKMGAEITGMITLSASRCVICNSDGCSLGRWQVCVEGDVSAHLYLMYVHINYSFFNKGKCLEF